MVLFLNEDNVTELITMPLALEQVERGRHHPALEGRVVGDAERTAELERHPQRARRTDGARDRGGVVSQRGALCGGWSR